MKINKKSLVKTSLVILLPVLIGILLWNQLPSQMATHFDIIDTFLTTLSWWLHAQPDLEAIEITHYYLKLLA